jgi:hypothetical protein
VAIHAAAPYKYKFVQTLRNAFGVNGIPTVKINRLSGGWNEQELQLTNQQAKPVGLGLAINTTVVNNNITIKIKVGFDLDYTKELKLVVILLEDGLLHDQVNSTAYYGGANPILNFEHNHVLRTSYTDIFGDAIASDKTKSGKEYSKTFNVTIPENVKNKNKLSIVAFVVKGSNKEVINVQKVALGSIQDFD